MYKQNLELLRSARAGTLRLCSAISHAQSELAPLGKWSAGEALHHLLLADDLYRGNFAQLIDLQRSGHSFADLNTSFAYIPKSLLPMLEIPFTVASLFVPNVVRETMMQFRFLPAQNPDTITPKKGQQTLYQHPIMGSNSVPQMLRIVSLHEQRHQSQIQDLLCLPQFSKVA